MRKSKHNKSSKLGWIARLKNGQMAAERDGVLWSSIKDQIAWLGLEDDAIPIISLPNGQTQYTQGKTGSCSLIGGSVDIESRWVGFEMDDGKKIKIKRSESNGRIEVDVI